VKRIEVASLLDQMNKIEGFNPESKFLLPTCMKALEFDSTTLLS
jgi:hypothetical protein